MAVSMKRVYRVVNLSLSSLLHDLLLHLLLHLLQYLLHYLLHHLPHYFLPVSLKMVLCTSKPTFSHDFLVPGVPCPFCDSTTTTPAKSAITASSAPPAPPALITETPPTLVIPELPTSAQESSTAITPTSSAVYAPGPLTTSFRQAIGGATATRSNAITTAKTASRPPPVYRFHIRVAHARFDPGSAIPKFIAYKESWNSVITANTTFRDWELRQHFLKAVEDVNLAHLRPIVAPQDHGKWVMASNYLDTRQRSPQIYQDWPGKRTIQDIILQQGYNLPKGHMAYPLTLIWYPKPDEAIAVDDESLPSVGDLVSRWNREDRIWRSSEPSTDAPGGHKRQLSSAIPRDERSNGREDDGAGQSKGKAAARDKNKGKGELPDPNVSRYGRARKATRKDC
jgi:hypothetical protein